MSDALTVRVSEIRAAADLLLNEVEAGFGAEVTLRHDYYWEVPLRSAFDVYQENPGSDVGAGQLSDDLAEAREVLAGRDEPSLWHDLSHFSALIRGLAALDLPA
jgi:hypothetical protein